jgi:integrase
MFGSDTLFGFFVVKNFGICMRKSTHWRTLNNLSKATRFSIPEMTGLHLWVRCDLRKYWIFRFTFGGRRHDISLGSFPAVTLANAKQKALKLRGQLFNGENPVEIRRAEAAQSMAAKKRISFKAFAEDYIERMSPKWSSAKYEDDWHKIFLQHAYPILGSMDIDAITTSHVLAVLNPIWTTKHVTASRVRGRIEKILSASITAGFRTSPNVAAWKNHLENLLPDINNRVVHFQALPYEKVPDLFKFLTSINTLPSLALQFLILNASRANEIIQAEKSQIIEGVWTIPAEKMKARSEHQIPLAPESISLIERASIRTQDSAYLFRIKGKRMHSQYMINLAQQFDANITTHGFRSTFRDWVSEETNHSPEVAEMALAHAIKNRVEAAYRRGKLLEKRKLLMTDWARFCFSKV